MNEKYFGKPKLKDSYTKVPLKAELFTSLKLTHHHYGDKHRHHVAMFSNINSLTDGHLCRIWKEIKHIEKTAAGLSNVTQPPSWIGA